MDKDREKRPNQLTLEEIAALAKEITLKSGEHMPTIIAEGSLRSATGQMVEYPATREEKTLMMLSAGFMFAQEGIGELKQVFFISEGWMSTEKEGGPGAVRPSQDPNRQEVLLISNLTIEGHRTKGAIFAMIRDAEGRLTELREVQQPEEEEDEKNRADSPLLDAFVFGFRSGRDRKID